MSIESSLTKLADFKDISFDDKAVTESGHTSKDIFCEGWPAAKKVLEAIETMVKNPIVKVIIGIVIKAGEALSTNMCGRQT